MPEPFDPDRMNADDIDVTDPDAITAWLDHPNTQALHADLGRAFREEPAAVQQAALQQVIDTDEARLRELVDALATRNYEPDVRQALEQLRDQMRQHIDAAKLRILELDD